MIGRRHRRCLAGVLVFLLVVGFVSVINVTRSDRADKDRAKLAGDLSTESHANELGHWGHGYTPAVSADCGGLGGRWCNYTATAERAWAAHFRNGWRVGGPFAGCGHIKGYVTICLVPRSQLPDGAAGQTEVRYTNNPDPHIDSAHINVCGDCGYSPSTLQAVVTHEYGHAIGLGHSVDRDSVMYPVVGHGNIGPNQHDNDALDDVYLRHVDPPAARVTIGVQVDGP